MLDEADEMLRMGFVDDVELILGMNITQFGVILSLFVFVSNANWPIKLSFLIFIYEGKVEDSSKVQTLLFSATLPSWVKQVCI